MQKITCSECGKIFFGYGQRKTCSRPCRTKRNAKLRVEFAAKLSPFSFQMSDPWENGPVRIDNSPVGIPEHWDNTLHAVSGWADY